ncbi:MAG: hypothetical protein K6T31_04180, partial [Alicyclobacillus sp.]|nr:hypothetical protein [Alicyclobacillus sp.]
MNAKAWGLAATGALLALATGCGGGASSPSPQNTSAPPAATNTAGNTGGSTATSAAADFYKGKTLTVIVPYGPGGGYDQWARLLAPYLQKYLGVAKVDVQNVTGGAGLVGTNQIYSAKPDGLTIGDTNAGGDVFDQITHQPGVQFDVTKINWLGRPDHDPGMIVARAGSPYKSFNDVLATKKSNSTVRVVSDGVGDNHYFGALIAMNAFNIPFHMIAAYKDSSELKAGFLRGDGDVVELSASDLMPLVQSGKATVIAMQSLTRWSQMPNIPTIAEIAQQQGLSDAQIQVLKSVAGVFEMGHAFMAPEGVPAD